MLWAEDGGGGASPGGGWRSWHSTAAWRACRVPAGRLGWRRGGELQCVEAAKAALQGGATFLGAKPMAAGKPTAREAAPLFQRKRAEKRKKKEEARVVLQFPKIRGAKLKSKISR